MKKYNLSKIMKRAWWLVKKAGMTISSGLKKAWEEAKNVRESVKMSVARNEYFTVNAKTGEVSGRTYNARKFLKENFDAKWNPASKTWTVNAGKFNDELNKYADYYKKYIICESTTTASEKKTVVSEKLVNRNDGFYKRVKYTDGTFREVFIG